MSNPTKERICGVIPLHGGYPCYLPEGHETYHSDGHTTWPTMNHKIAPDPHALLRDKLRELAEGWLQQAYALDVLSSPAERIETHAKVRLLENCARELGALIEGAK